MFYSQLLLSKKGALGTIWVAAHCFQKLKKEQVHKTNISSSVDKILNDEVAVFTHRILAFLLLGVVKIYSKKVEYLFHDCQDVLNKLTEFKTDKNTRKSSGTSQTINAVGLSLPIPKLKRTRHSITLPKRFELDAFDLELTEYQDMEGRNVRPREEIMLLGDGREKEGSTRGFMYKENVSFSEAQSTDYTPPRDVLFIDQMDQDHSMSPINNTNTSVPSSLETFRATSFSLEDRLEPMLLNESDEKLMHDKPSYDIMVNFQGMDHDVNASPSHNKSDHSLRLEMLNGTRLDLEDRLKSMVVGETGKEEINDGPFDDNGNFMEKEHLEPQLSFQANEFHKLTENDNVTEEEHLQENESHKEEAVVSKKLKYSEKLIPENGESQRSEANPVSITVNVTPDSKVADFAAVLTPAPMESVKISKKRKSIIDDTTMIPGDVYREWINNPSDLIRKRKIVPHTCLHAWKVDKLRRTPHSFTEPLVGGICIDMRSLERQKKTLEPPELYEVGSPVMKEDQEQTEAVGFPVMKEDQEQTEAVAPVMKEDQEQTEAVGSLVDEDGEQTVDIGSPIAREQTPIAPGTPVTRSFEIGVVAADSEVLGPAISFESIEKGPSPSVVMDLDAFLLDETNSSEGDSLEKDTYSARTRMVGSYLHKNFVDKKMQKKDEVLNLSQILEGKTKKESARLFYETLVLKTRDCIDVQQENAYGDVLLRETSKLKILNLDKEE
ncbi:hypothetical protein ACJIZ3_018310 [Penstemon smallii]|uniref:Sister chromatid cohesion 1 protein 2 n=1 Tax=Penstemon smallii TaxID=265156 RepID=A0ABD3SYJ0_9LAMI